MSKGKKAAQGVKVRLTVYKDKLVIETVDPEKPYPGWTPHGEGNVGCMIQDTKNALGASREALEWLKAVKRSGDAIGEVMWIACSDGTKAFGWLGGVYRIGARGIDSCRKTQVYETECVIIPNESPKEAKEHIDATS